MAELAATWQPPERAPSVAELIEAMNATVAGLDDAKAQLAVLLHRHAVAGINQRDAKLPNVLVIGESGCLAPDTEIETPYGPRAIELLAGWNLVMGPFGPALAYGYSGGMADMHRVTHGHGSFVATAAHRSLIQREGVVSWSRVSDLCVGDTLLGFSEARPRSSSGTGPSARAEDDPRFWQTVLDSLENCSGDCHLRGEQPRWAITFFQGLSPSQVGALARTRIEHPDDLVHGLAHIPTCQSFGLLARRDYAPSDCLDRGSFVSRFRDTVDQLLLGCTPAPLQSPALTDHPWLALEVGLHPNLDAVAPDVTSKIVSIEPVGRSEFYDLLIPGAPYYRTKRGWTHHNGGKSVLVHAACEAAALPYIEVNATQFSEVGFAGLDVSQMLAGFWGPRWCPPPAKRGQVVPLAERFGVVVIDEIDKWAFHPNLKERQPQRVLQAELLRFVEGEVARVREKDSEMGTPFDTTHLLFIGTGAFQSLGQMVDPTDPQAYTKADSSHIEKYGFLTELAGRFSTIIGLPRLDSNSMARILREQVWPSYLQQMEDDGLEVLVEDAALRRIGDIAIAKYTGARGLIPELERLLKHAWRQAKPGGLVRLTLDDVDAGRAVYIERVAA